MRPVLTLLLLASLVTAGCTGGEESEQEDRDEDGMSDLAETRPRLITIERVAGPETRSVTSDPGDPDTDDDGLTDVNEFGFATDPRDVDTDGDGLLDGPNLTLPEGSAFADTLRGRGIHESPAGTFLGELSQCPQYGGLKPHVESSDRPTPDRLGDGEERLGWNVTLRGVTRHVASDPCTSDADRDALPDDLERAAGSDPGLVDSDGDGTQDGNDADPAADLHLVLRAVSATTRNGTAVTLTFAAGLSSATLQAPGQTSAELAVDDQTSTRGSLLVGLLVGAEDAQGRRVALTPNPGGAILYLDLLQGTVAIDGSEPRVLERVELAGDDGTLSFSWGALRR